ncbi:MAG TPA: pyridoxamine 5'-phosphate oxidase family protein [Actinomycetota bacterium]|nr:pyridoxamine 5'-phosphate oxidase family protein [Actinomycetota bacterium]
MRARPTDRTQVRRHPERGHYDREVIHAILDEAFFCHLGYVLDGMPKIIPTIHARAEDTLYLHGSTASRSLKAIADHPVCVVVTLLDGLVLARSAFNHSMNYRSAVVYGTGRLVTDPDEKWRAQRALVEHVMPGRADDARMPNDRELKQTSIVAVAIDEASAKIRTGPPKDAEADYDLDVWAGVLPLALRAGNPQADPVLPAGIPVPPYLRRRI